MNDSNDAYENYLRFSYPVNGPITATVVFCGIISNTCCLITLIGAEKRRSIHKYLVALSVWDILLLSNAFLLYSLTTIMNGNGENTPQVPYAHTSPFWYTGSNISLLGTLWVVLLLTLDRYLALCKPFFHLRFFADEERCRWALLLISMAAFIYGSPCFFELRIQTFSPNISNTSFITYETLVESPHRKEFVYRIVYRIIGSLLLYSLLPFIILVGLTIQISIAVRKSSTVRRRMTRRFSRNPNSTRCTSFTHFACEDHETERMKSEGPVTPKTLDVPGSALADVTSTFSFTNHRYHTPSQSTRSSCNFRDESSSFVRRKRCHVHRSSGHSNIMPVVLISKFLISHSFPTFLDLFEVFFPLEYNTPLGRYLIDISNLLVICNSATNFWIYLIWSKEFRSEVVNSLKGLSLHGNRRGFRQRTVNWDQESGRKLGTTSDPKIIRIMKDTPLVARKSKSVIIVTHKPNP